MRITRIDVYGYELSYAHGEYVMSGGRAARTQPSTLVRVATDEGVDGWGETCPLGGTYLEAFAGGVRAALAELAPLLIGADPFNLGRINAMMDATLLGQRFAKSALDIACWDILGRATGMPLTTLLGGRASERLPLYMAVPVGTVEAMVTFTRARRSEGVRHFQVKVGEDPHEDAERVRAILEVTNGDGIVVADANGGWTFQDALIAARRLEALPTVHLEQPCRTMAECVRLRGLTSLPMVYDECVLDAESLEVAVRDGGAGAVNLKIGRLGGLTGARLLRDLAVSRRVPVTIEDSWGGDVATAAISHLAASTPPEALFTVAFFNDWTREHVAGHAPASEHGTGAAPDGPGLGIEVDEAGLGAPLWSCS